MKKIFVLLMILFGFSGYNLAYATEEPQGISFIYINGSNNLAYNNRLKFKTAFLEDVKKLHPEIKQRFEQDELINEIFLQNGRYKINPEPITFYWGDRSLKVVETLDRDLKTSSKYSPKIAHQARSIFAHCLHDAVWVQKPYNMTNVLNDLHKIINTEVAKGNKVVLLGYSAGSFVTYQYYMKKSNSIMPAQIFSTNEKVEIVDFINKTPVQSTCFDALIDADLLKYNYETGKYSMNNDVELFKRNYVKLDSYTEKACFSRRNSERGCRFCFAC